MSENVMGKYTRTFTITVTTKVEHLVSEDPKRVALLVYNNGSGTVYILSAQNQAYTDGIPVTTKTSYSNDSTTAGLYIVTDTGTDDVRVQVDGN